MGRVPENFSMVVVLLYGVVGVTIMSIHKHHQYRKERPLGAFGGPLSGVLERN